MSALFVSLILAFQAHAAGHRRSPLIDEEREALERISAQFETFREQIAATDEELLALRRRARSGQASRWDSRRAISMVRTSRLQWNAIERAYDNAWSSGLRLNRLINIRKMDLAPDVLTFLTFRYNQRFGNGTPMPLLLMAWRGLGLGEKSEEPPGRIRSETKIADVKIGPTDTLLLMSIHGALVRGRFEGTYGDSLVLREVLPGPLSRMQARQGHYRRLTLEDIARMEIIRAPETVKLQNAPSPAIDGDGDYSAYYAAEVIRIDFQPDDLALVDWVDQGRKTGYRHPPYVSVVDRSREVRPAYAGVYFADCDSLLRRR